MGESNFDALAAYAMGADSARSNSSGGMGDMSEWVGLAMFALIFGGLGNGNGGGLFGGGGGSTKEAVADGFALNNLENGIRSLANGLSDGFYAMNTGLLTGFNNIGAQLAQCCCDNRAATADLKYSIGSEFCSLGNTIQSSLRDVIDNQNANYRGIMDFMVSEKLASKDARIVELTNQLSQSNQNAVIGARIDAAVAEVLRRTGNDCPTAAYLVQPPTPVNFPTNGCGTVQFGGWGGRDYGCGCGCGC